MELLSLSLSNFQLYGLIFLLGSFSVASLSDLKRMSAQREFLEIWLLFSLVFLGNDIFIGYTEGADLTIYIKWGLIGVFLILWFFKVILKTAVGDALACVAVMSLLTPLFIIIFLIFLKLSEALMGPLLKAMFGGKDSYPFLPVVSIATIITLIVGLRASDWIERFL